MVERKLGTRCPSWHKGKVDYKKWEEVDLGIKKDYVVC